jgi:alanyl-tRNA synthetase
MRGNLRFEFLCGRRALQDYAWRTEALLEAARKRTLKDRELIAHLEKAAAERDELEKRLSDLVTELVAREARERVGSPPRGVTEWFSARPRDEVRLLAIKCLEMGAPWAVVGAAAPDPALVVGRPKSGGADLRALLPPLLETTGGKGGGSADFLQVSAPDATAMERGWALAAERLRHAT